VLAVIPAMLTAADRRRLKRRRILLALSASAATIALAVAAAVATWRPELIANLVR
jgi:hypothetical protein